MKKLKIYKNGDMYITGGIAGIQPNGVDPIEEYDLSDLTEKELEQLQKNKADKGLRKKIRRIK